MMIIEDMNIERCGQTCTCDYLEVQNGISSDDYYNGRRCGYRRLVRYHSISESLTMLFVSNGNHNKLYRGFKATYIQANHNASIPGEWTKNKKKKNKKKEMGESMECIN